MKTIKPATANQFIYFKGFTLSTGENPVDVIFAVDGYNRRLFDPRMFNATYTFEDFIEYVRSVLDLPEVAEKLSKVTIVMDAQPQFKISLKKAVNRPVRVICDYDINEEMVKDTRDDLKRTWADYTSNTLFSLAS